MKRLFTSDGFFLTAVICAVIGSASFMFYSLSEMPMYSYLAVIMAFNAISTVALYVSYKKHSKNVMKGLIGFLLMGFLAFTVTAVFPLEPGQMFYMVVSLVELFAVMVLCINHFVINSDHHSRSANVRLNQLLLFLIFILYVTMAAAWIIGATGAIAVFYFIGVIAGAFGTTASVVCVESRLDAYRINREAAGWTEEKGYPEGYIHGNGKK